MNYAETARLLATVSAIDNRRIDEATVATWHGVLGDLPANLAIEAVRRHFARSTNWLMPAHIRDGVRTIRDERRPRHETLAIPSKFEADPDRDARVRRGMAQVAAALSIAMERRPKAIDATEKPPPTRSDQIRAVAIARAISERGGSPKAIESAPGRDKRKRNSRDGWVTAHVPDLGPVRTCTRCPGEGSRYTEDAAGMTAHRAVFGHTPAESEAA